LLDLQSKLECQQSKTTHLELHPHILLELLDLTQSRAHDDEVIDVHLNNELASIGALAVDGMLVLSLWRSAHLDKVPTLFSFTLAELDMSHRLLTGVATPCILLQ
jgi:hypothetical protein